MENTDQLEELWMDLSPEARRLVGRVIRLERDKLHMSLPRGINDDIEEAVEEVVTGERL